MCKKEMKNDQEGEKNIADVGTELCSLYLYISGAGRTHEHL